MTPTYIPVKFLLDPSRASHLFPDRQLMLEDAIRLGPSKPKLKQYQELSKFIALKYQQVEWICGCEERGRFFCFPCLIFVDRTIADPHFVHDGVRPPDLTTALLIAHSWRRDHIYAVNNQGNVTVGLNQKYQQQPYIFKEPTDFADLNELHIVSHHLQIFEMYPITQLDLFDSPVLLTTFYDFFTQRFPEHRGAVLRREGMFQHRVHLHRVLHKAISHEMCDAVKRTDNRKSPYCGVHFEDESFRLDTAEICCTFRYIDSFKERVNERHVGFTRLTANDDTVEKMVHFLDDVVKRYMNTPDPLVAVSMTGLALSNTELAQFIIRVKKSYPHVQFVPDGPIDYILACRLHYVCPEAKTFFFYLIQLRKLVGEKSSTVGFMVKEDPTSLKCSSLHRFTCFVDQHRITLIKFLQYWYNLSTKSEVRNCLPLDMLTDFWGYLKDFISCLLTPFFIYVFLRASKLNKIIIRKLDDWAVCQRELENFANDLESYKMNNFKSLYELAIITMANAQRIRLSVDEPEFSQATPPYDFSHPRVKKYYSDIVDKLFTAAPVLLQHFYLDLIKPMQYYNLVVPSKFVYYSTKGFPNSLFDCLESTYPGWFNIPQLKIDLSIVYRETKSRKYLGFKPPEFLMMFTHSRMAEPFPELSKLCQIVLAIPSACIIVLNTGQILTSRADTYQFMSSRQINYPEWTTDVVSPEGHILCDSYLLRWCIERNRAMFHRNVVHHFFQYLQEEGKPSEKDFEVSLDMAATEQYTNHEVDDVFHDYVVNLSRMPNKYWPFRSKTHKDEYYSLTYKDRDDWHLNFNNRYLRLLAM